MFTSKIISLNDNPIHPSLGPIISLSLSKSMRKTFNLEMTKRESDPIAVKIF